MLVLTRKPGEKIVIGNDITIILLGMSRGRVRLGVEAPDDVRILRSELSCWQQEPPPTRPQLQTS